MSQQFPIVKLAASASKNPRRNKRESNDVSQFEIIKKKGCRVSFDAWKIGLENNFRKNGWIRDETLVKYTVTRNMYGKNNGFFVTFPFKMREETFHDKLRPDIKETIGYSRKVFPVLSNATLEKVKQVDTQSAGSVHSVSISDDAQKNRKRNELPCRLSILDMEDYPNEVFSCKECNIITKNRMNFEHNPSGEDINRPVLTTLIKGNSTYLEFKNKKSLKTLSGFLKYIQKIWYDECIEKRMENQPAANLCATLLCDFEQTKANFKSNVAICYSHNITAHSQIVYSNLENNLRCIRFVFNEFNDEIRRLPSFKLVRIRQISFHITSCFLLKNKKFYIELPPEIKRKNACVNVKESGEKSFVYAILCKLLIQQGESQPHIISKYKELIEHPPFNFDCITFPVSLDEISDFENKNLGNISVDIYRLQKATNGKYEVVTAFQSSYYYSAKVHMDLLYLENNFQSHFVYIKNLRALVNVTE